MALLLSPVIPEHSGVGKSKEFGGWLCRYLWHLWHLWPAFCRLLPVISRLRISCATICHPRTSCSACSAPPRCTLPQHTLHQPKQEIEPVLVFPNTVILEWWFYIVSPIDSLYKTPKDYLTGILNFRNHSHTVTHHPQHVECFHRNARN